MHLNDYTVVQVKNYTQYGAVKKTFLEVQKSGFLIHSKWAKNDTENGFEVLPPTDGLATEPNIPQN